MPHKLGEVRVADEADFEAFINICDENTDWDMLYNKNDLLVWTRLTEDCSFKMFRVRYTLKDVAASTLYDVLHDPKYRKVWDRSMLESQEVGLLSPNTDICYYALRSMPPFKNRDFVMQRTWRQTENEYIIFNHSVFHKKLPPKKTYVRALSHLTGYLIRPLSETSCQLHYVAHCDPRGKLPKWAVNRAAHLVAPSVVKRLGKAARAYPDWKRKHDPELRPWLLPDQNRTPPLEWSEVLSRPDIDLQAAVVDESSEKEIVGLVEDDSPAASGEN